MSNQLWKSLPNLQLFSPVPVKRSKFLRRRSQNLESELHQTSQQNSPLRRRLCFNGTSRQNTRRLIPSDDRTQQKEEIITRRSLNALVRDCKFMELSSNLTDEDNNSFLKQVEMIDD